MLTVQQLDSFNEDRAVSIDVPSFEIIRLIVNDSAFYVIIFRCTESNFLIDDIFALNRNLLTRKLYFCLEGLVHWRNR